MIATVRVFSDLTCPWAYLTAWRLCRLAPAYAGRVRFVWASLPLEVVNREPTRKDVIEAELPIVREAEPDLPLCAWAAPAWTWPVTVLPAFEAVKCAEAQGDAAAAEYSWRVRHAFFAESRCIALRHVLLELAAEAGLDVDRFADDLDHGRYRASVMAESRAGWVELKVAGSPTLVLPDGSQHPAPALPRVELAGARILSVQPAECPGGDCLRVLRDLLERACAAASTGARASS